MLSGQGFVRLLGFPRSFAFLDIPGNILFSNDQSNEAAHR
jgi:hypothetical protein